MSDIKFTAKSELMLNHKAGKLMPDQQKYQVLQTRGGNALIFCTSNEGDLSVIAERPGTKTGWSITNLSFDLSRYAGKHVSVHQFSVAQEQTTKQFTIALTAQAVDSSVIRIYALTGLPDIDGSDWMISDESHKNWTTIDRTDLPSRDGIVIPGSIIPFPIFEAGYVIQIYFVCIETADSKWETYTRACSSNDSFNTSWKKVNLGAGGADADKILAQAQGALNGYGLYQLADVSGEIGVYWCPVSEGSEASREDTPNGVTALSSLPNNTAISDLFVVAEDKLFHYDWTDVYCTFEQHPVMIVQNPIVTGVKQLHSHLSKDYVNLWGLNSKGVIFYSKCKRSNDMKKPANWSYPIPLLTGVKKMSSYVNPNTNAAVAFTLMDEGNEMIQLMQSYVTTDWKQRSIILPSLDLKEVREFYSYTTHIQLTKGNGLPIGKTKVSITSTSPCSTYINDMYMMLYPDIPVVISTDNGIITIVQETGCLGSTCYYIKPDGMEDWASVNPMNKMVKIMSQVTDLGKVTFPDGKSLLPEDTTQDNKDAMNKALGKFVAMAHKMNPDGSVKKDTSSGELSDDDPGVEMWGVDFDESGNFHYHEAEGSEVGGSWWLDAIEAVAGDIAHWLKHAYQAVTKFLVRIEKGIVHFFVQIEKQAFKFVMKCISDVVNAVETVFNKIKVFFENLVKWLGFLFEWEDIVSTHKVFHNIIRQYLRNAVVKVGDIESDIKNAFTKANEQIDNWSGLKSLKGTLGEKSQSSPRMPHLDSPQANYGVHHLNSNASSATTKYSPPTPDSTLGALLKALTKDVDKEECLFNGACTAMKGIAGDIDTLPLGDIIKNVLGVLAKFLTGTVENIVVSVLKVVQILIEGVESLLDAPIDIPVISWLYKKFISGNEPLTILDAVCLVAAIPATVVFKIAENEAPYPADDEFTQKLIGAGSWTTIEALFQNSREQIGGDNTDQPSKLDKSIHIASSVCAFAFDIFFVLKASKKGGKPISCIHCALFFVTTAPTMIIPLTSPHYYKDFILGMSETLYVFTSALKLCGVCSSSQELNKILKIADGVLGVVGMVPIIWKLAIDGPSYALTAVGKIIWCINRIFTFGLLVAPDNPVYDIFVALKAIFIFTFGAIQAIEAK